MGSPLRNLDELGDAVRQTIRAFHGSPYDFDKFDASKIGTGEGAQAYGHGLYFAGNEDTAEFYRRTATATNRTPEQDAQEFIRRAYQKRGNLVGAVLDVMDRADASHAEAIANGMEEAASRWDKIRAAAAAFNVNNGVPQRLGRTYEVEIGAPDAALLDWDKPMGGEIAGRLTPALRSGLERGVRERLDMGQLERHAGNLRGMLDEPALAPGQVLHEGLLADLGAVGASKKLLDAGIPGIRYLDAGSRSAGQGTRNYVMFPGTEDQIRILRKYGLLAPMAAAGTMGEE